MKKTERKSDDLASIQKQGFHSRIAFALKNQKYLDSLELTQLEQSFREWIDAASRPDIRISRKRVFLIFILIRYTGAKLSEVLSIDPLKDIDFESQYILLGRLHEKSENHHRKVHISTHLCHELKEIILDSQFKDNVDTIFKVDPGFVRRKFYERAESCNIPKQLGAPETLRKSRAVELMQSNMPLPAIQMLLGHSTTNLTSAYVSFSEDDLQQVTKLFMEKESNRKTSARNSFFGKVQSVEKGDIQARIELITISGYIISTVITNSSLDRLGIKKDRFITAEVKAPYVILQKMENEIKCSADNILNGTVQSISIGEINTEYIVQVSDGTEVCAIVTTKSCNHLGLNEGDSVWVMFNSFSVLLSE